MTTPHRFPAQGAPDDTRANRALSRDNLNTYADAIEELQTLTGGGGRRTVLGTFTNGTAVCTFDTSAHPVHPSATAADLLVTWQGVIVDDTLVTIAVDRLSVTFDLTPDGQTLTTGEVCRLKYPAVS